MFQVKHFVIVSVARYLALGPSLVVHMSPWIYMGKVIPASLFSSYILILYYINTI